MERYESLGVVGEGSYGLVLRCRHRESGQLVAVKKFIETEEDLTVRKMALREIRMLKKLRHENLVSLLEVFRRKRRFYLVFELMDHTVLDELEERPGGLGSHTTRQHIFQVIRAVEFCHANNIVHRDVKPENVLVSRLGVVKLCDFGFARLLASPGKTYTDYVATRWYRAPELLVGDNKYGKAVDIWAVGCLFSEMLSGDPLFPGQSDIDQLFQIIKVLGKLSPRHQQLAARNPMFRGLKRGPAMPGQSASAADDGARSLAQLFPNWPRLALDAVSVCLRLDPSHRPSADHLLRHPYFTHDRFPERFVPELRVKVQQEYSNNPLLRRLHGSGTSLTSARSAGQDAQDDVKASLTAVPMRRVQGEGGRWRVSAGDPVPSTQPNNPVQSRRRDMDPSIPTQPPDVAMEDIVSRTKFSPILTSQDVGEELPRTPLVDDVDIDQQDDIDQENETETREEPQQLQVPPLQLQQQNLANLNPVQTPSPRRQHNLLVQSQESYLETAQTYEPTIQQLAQAPTAAYHHHQHPLIPAHAPAPQVTAPPPAPVSWLQPSTQTTEVNQDSTLQLVNNNLSFTPNSQFHTITRPPETTKRSPLPGGGGQGSLRLPGRPAPHPGGSGGAGGQVAPSVPRQHLMARRLERSTIMLESDHHEAPAPPPRWKYNRPEDDFCLPNVPGASGSPNKGRRKQIPGGTGAANGNHGVHGSTTILRAALKEENSISPRRPSSRSPSVNSRAPINNLPFV